MNQTGSSVSRIDTDAFIKGLWRENPVFVQVLGMCPVLAVSNTATNAIAMGLASTFVLIMSSSLVSVIRNFIPKQVRIASYILIIATFVTMVEYFIQAISIELHKALGAYISLIVVNCIILGRAEAFASKNTIGRAFLDALGMGVGFTFALLCLGVVRELIGVGSIFGISIFGPHYEPWMVMILPGGGFFTLGAWLLFFNWLKEREKKRTASITEMAERGAIQ
jgi:electron transport complex protein RnfE